MTNPSDRAAAAPFSGGTMPTLAGVARSVGVAAEAAERERVREIDGAARAFETLLVQRMLGDMRRAARGGDDGSNAMSNWESMFDERIAGIVTEGGGLGLGDALSRDLGGSGHVALVQQASRTGLPAADVRALRRIARGGDAPDGDGATAAPVRRPEAGLAMPATAVAELAENGLETGFLAPLHAHAERNARRLGTRPEAILAVAALETGWGRHRIVDRAGVDSNNLFGIKATGTDRADGVAHRTTEFIGGAPRRVEAEFRRFDSVGEAVDGFADFVLDNPRYAPALAVADDPERFLRALHRAGYATDPDYADKVVELMRRVRALLDADAGRATGTPAAPPAPHGARATTTETPS